ncbi:MAG TPA: GTP cyclohydrolase I FolE [Actinomycetota bacterium]|nr:GTP cyclohydrolase I FolE [Actinomycetota bacterium]
MTATSFDRDRIAAGVRQILEGLGEDLTREGIARTPERVAEMFEEILGGTFEDPASILKVRFDEGHDEMIMVRDIPVASICEHHLVPWIGKAHVAYIPNRDGRITGISKLARVVDTFAHRLQVQERMTMQVADAIEQALEPRGVLVVVEAEHLCMTMRGVRKPGSQTVTSAVRGLFRKDPRTRAEAFNLIDAGRRGAAISGPVRGCSGRCQARTGRGN